MSKLKVIVLSILIIIIFLFLRFWNINNSLFFSNDMGRDLLVLLEMIQNKKLVLLGPQTSALPINQSPLYFYLLLPLYIITNKSFLTANFTLTFIYLSLFIFNLYLYRTNKKIIFLVFISFFLISIHPQYILQGRFVWNPSFVTPFLMTSIIALFYQKILISSLFITIALSLSYSIAPLIISMFIYCLTFNRKIFFKFITYFLLFFFILNLSVIRYEIKKYTAFKTFISPNQIYQTGNTYLNKIENFKSYVLATNNSFVDNILLFGLFLIFIFSIKSKNKLIKYLSLLFIFTSILTIFSPFNLQAHYIFALSALLFLIIGSLNSKVSFVIACFLSIFYLSPQKLSLYFQKTPRTYQQMDVCFKNYCQQQIEPIYVSVQSNLYPYHYGPEHRYLMKLNNCQVKHIETQNGQAKYMAVVLDNGGFSDKTNYYELSLFGKFKQLSTFNCLSNFKVVTLEKI